VLYLNHTGLPGGAEIALSRLLGAIDRERITPLVVFGDDGPAVEMVKQNGVEAIVAPLRKVIRDMRKDTLRFNAFLNLKLAALMVAYSMKIARIARRRGIHLIHTNTVKAHVYGALAGQFAGLPVVWHVRDCVNRSYFPRAAVNSVRFLARMGPKHVIGVSRWVMEQLNLNKYVSSSTVIPDGLPEAQLCCGVGGTLDPTPRKGAWIGMIGRIARWKGQHVFLVAAARIVKAGHDVNFVIAGAPLFGEEEYEAELRRQVVNLGLASRVEFLGFTRDIPGVLRRLNILVHASITGEPFGQVIVEGMAAGRPVIATRGGGVPEIITHGETGLLTEMGDVQGLARGVIFLLENPQFATCLGQAGLEHVRQKFKASVSARKVESVYESLFRDQRIDLLGRDSRLVRVR